MSHTRTDTCKVPLAWALLLVPGYSISESIKALSPMLSDFLPSLSSSPRVPKLMSLETEQCSQTQIIQSVTYSSCLHRKTAPHNFKLFAPSPLYGHWPPITWKSSMSGYTCSEGWLWTANYLWQLSVCAVGHTKFSVSCHLPDVAKMIPRPHVM